MGTTADKIAKIAIARARSGALDLASFRAAQSVDAKAPSGGGRLGELLKGHDPAHAVLLYAQNFTSFLAEEMSGWKELRQYAKIVGDAEDRYVPGFPPMSPLSTSYFTMWAFFDVLFGQSRETIGTCIQRIARTIDLSDPLTNAIDAMQESRMGFYRHCGFEGRFVRLREIGDGDARLSLSTSGYKGLEGQIWFTRLVAPVRDSSDAYHVVMTTPYVILYTPEAMIADYLNREIERVRDKRLHQMDPLTFIMKHGPTPNHWNEYVMDGYSNFQSDAIFLTGVPDRPETLPHAL